MTGYVYDDIFLRHISPGHPESPERLKTIMQKLNDENLLAQLEILPALEATEDDLLLVHAKEVLVKVREAVGNAPAWLDPDTYVSKDSYRAASLAAGGGIRLVSEIQTGGIQNGMALVRPPGHHATVSRSMGFCLFNNIAIAARYLQRHFGLSRIAIIDWDVHHGNGTQDIFYDDPSVLYLSTHLFPHYPGTGSHQETGVGQGQNTTMNIPFRHGISREHYLERFTEGLKTVRQFHPDFILISAGFDSHAADPLGGLSLLEADFGLMTSQICELARAACQGKVASFLEGGYHLQALADSVLVHLQTLLEFNKQ
ncbi:MAG: histone deacetylase [bacterium]|nr:MAG: histone deacetylase [bacterium]